MRNVAFEAFVLHADRSGEAILAADDRGVFGFARGEGRLDGVRAEHTAQ